RRRHRNACRSRCAHRQPARRGGAQAAMTDTLTPVADTPETVAMAKPAPTEPWRRRILRALLYGKADRHAKARGRIGLAMIAFTAVYAVIAGRLIVYAMTTDSHIARRGTAGDAVATARPDIVDRRGEVLATDVKAPSLFGEPRRIIDKDEAIELLTATLPDLDTGEVRDRLSSKIGSVWLNREITQLQQQETHLLGLP